MNVIINGHEYMMNTGYSVDEHKERYFLNIITDSIDDLVEVLGDKVTLEIPNEFVINNLSIESVKKEFNSGDSICFVTLKKYPYEDVLKEQAADIEAISQAIEELAEIIGGE